LIRVPQRVSSSNCDTDGLIGCCKVHHSSLNCTYRLVLLRSDTPRRRIVVPRANLLLFSVLSFIRSSGRTPSPGCSTWLSTSRVPVALGAKRPPEQQVTTFSLFVPRQSGLVSVVAESCVVPVARVCAVCSHRTDVAERHKTIGRHDRRDAGHGETAIQHEKQLKNFAASARGPPE
jgi:hypothetical protein